MHRNRAWILPLCLSIAATLVSGCLGMRSEGGPPPTGATAELSPWQMLSVTVAPQPVPCPDDPAKSCLEVRFGPGEPYQALAEPIEGFAYEAGYEYELVVERQTSATPAASGQAVRYRLIQVVAKVPATAVPATPGSQSGLLEGRIWQLVTQRSATGETVPALAGTPVEARFVEGNVAGNTGCNSYNAAYVLQGQSLTIQPPVTTLIGCDKERMTQEKAFLANLSAVRSFQIEDERLVLHDEAGATLATFRAAVSAASSTASLTGTVWRWVASYYANETATVVDDPTKYTLEFRPEGELEVQADCNTLIGSYREENGGLTIRLETTTLAVCPEGSLAEKFLAELKDVATYVLPEAGTLVLNMKMDAGDLQFTAAP